MSKRQPIATGSEWTFELIQQYDREISRIAERYALDTYPNQIEVITAEQMMDAYASVGMPIGYNHWSYGKHFLSTEKNYKRGQMGRLIGQERPKPVGQSVDLDGVDHDMRSRQRQRFPDVDAAKGGVGRDKDDDAVEEEDLGAFLVCNHTVGLQQEIGDDVSQEQGGEGFSHVPCFLSPLARSPTGSDRPPRRIS